MVNLVLVLLIAQAVQVLLLAIAVFAFFMMFGAVAIDDSVIQTWIADEDGVHHIFGIDAVSQELLQVSVFLAAFAGLYFTVYAITDEVYRKEFFTVIMNELRRAVGARVVYRALRRAAAPPGD
jgi:hypothetical protein